MNASDFHRHMCLFFSNSFCTLRFDPSDSGFLQQRKEQNESKHQAANANWEPLLPRMFWAVELHAHLGLLTRSIPQSLLASWKFSVASHKKDNKRNVSRTDGTSYLLALCSVNLGYFRDIRIALRRQKHSCRRCREIGTQNFFNHVTTVLNSGVVTNKGLSGAICIVRSDARVSNLPPQLLFDTLWENF